MRWCDLYATLIMAFHLNDYLPILLMFVVAGGFAAGNIVLSQFVGQRKHTRTKMMPYECGKDPVGTARERFSVKFYLIAILFIIFDIETVFMIPWGVYYKQLSCAEPVVRGVCPPESVSFFGLGEMIVFMVILFVGFVYVWKKGALQWD